MVRYTYNYNEISKEVIQGLLGKYAYIAKVADEKLAYKQKVQYNFSIVEQSDGSKRLAIDTVYNFNDENGNRAILSVAIHLGKDSKYTIAEKRFSTKNKPFEITNTNVVYKDWVIASEKKLADVLFYTFGA